MIGTGRVWATSADQRAQRDDHLHSQPLGDLRDTVGKGAPAEVRLGAGEQDGVAFGALWRRGKEHVAGPFDLAGLTFGQPDRRPVRLEVEEVLRVDLGDDLGFEDSAAVVSAVVAAPAASFQPANAQINAGERR